MCSNYFNGVEWVSGEDKADTSKPSSEEILQRADRLRLFGHFHLPLWKKNTTVASEWNRNRHREETETHRENNINNNNNNVSPGRPWLCERNVFTAVTFHPVIDPDRSDCNTAWLWSVSVWCPGGNKTIFNHRYTCIYIVSMSFSF